MNRPKENSTGDSEVRIQVSWRYRMSGAAAARLIITVVLVLATAAATLAHQELAGGALYGVAGFIAGSRPRTRP